MWVRSNWGESVFAQRMKLLVKEMANHLKIIKQSFLLLLQLPLLLQEHAQGADISLEAICGNKLVGKLSPFVFFLSSPIARWTPVPRRSLWKWSEGLLLVPKRCLGTCSWNTPPAPTRLQVREKNNTNLENIKEKTTGLWKMPWLLTRLEIKLTERKRHFTDHAFNMINLYNQRWNKESNARFYLRSVKCLRGVLSYWWSTRRSLFWLNFTWLNENKKNCSENIWDSFMFSIQLNLLFLVGFSTLVESFLGKGEQDCQSKAISRD